MTKEQAIKQAQRIASSDQIVMAVANDPIANNPEEDTEGPWSYCPMAAVDILFRWRVELVEVRP